MILILTTALALPWLLEAEGPRLFSAIREGDTAGLRQLLGSGASVNGKDESGATPLMYAAAYGSAQDLALLLDAGADINAANTYGSTALMWAAQDTNRVKLLLDRGAAVAVRAVDRTTPLLSAARFGNLEAMRLLIARGALANAAAADTTNLLRVAYTPEGGPVRLLLEEHGVRLTDPGALAVPVVGVNVTDPPLIERLLGLGANPNQTFQTVTLAIPAVALAAVAGEPATIGALAAHGANLNAAGTHGYTALMMAAASPRPDPSIVRSLILNGADVDARDDVGRTALDWALLQGETPAAAALNSAGARAMAPSPAAPPAVTAPRSAADAGANCYSRLRPH
jgi:serine/threonine-protein phosphatase 6 regulatory ankyrin repeat subunit B